MLPFIDYSQPPYQLDTMQRLGYERVRAALLGLPLVLLGMCSGVQAELNDSPQLRLVEQGHKLLNGTNVWSVLPVSLPLLVPAHIGKDVQESDRHGAFLARSSVIYGLAELANSSNVNALCHAQLKQVQRGILSRQPWAMKGRWSRGIYAADSSSLYLCLSLLQFSMPLAASPRALYLARTIGLAVAQPARVCSARMW